MKKTILFAASLVAGLIALCNTASASSLWRCVATDARGATWFQYAATRPAAAAGARSRCRAGSYRPTCVVRCNPPRVRWRCVSSDRAGRTWYWVSAIKRTAIANARRACVHNSNVGGCHVSPGSCSAS